MVAVSFINKKQRELTLPAPMVGTGLASWYSLQPGVGFWKPLHPFLSN